MSNHHIVIFDGLCIFCNGAVKFIIRRDPEGVFSFAPMQSESGKNLIQKYNAKMVGVDTFLLIKEGRCYERTDAAFEITRDLTGLWFMIRIFKVLPRAFRDYFYKLFARNRYKLFGKREHCMIPTPDIRKRFIE